MHSRKRGKAGSKRPINKTASWVRYSAKELELLVLKLAKEGKSPSLIGMTLRDSYGVPDIKQVTQKSIVQILKAKDMQPKIPEDLMALIRKSIIIRKHREDNKKDMPAKRGLMLTESKIRRLMKYYKRNGILDQSWTYDPDKIRLLVD